AQARARRGRAWAVSRARLFGYRGRQRRRQRFTPRRSLTRLADHDYDLFVIGAGSGGVRAARMAAELGALVGIAAELRVGRHCVIRGCVPKKLLVYGSQYASDFADARGFGWSCDNLRFDWPTLIHNVKREVDRLNGVYTRILEKAGVDRFLTRAVLAGPHE